MPLLFPALPCLRYRRRTRVDECRKRLLSFPSSARIAASFARQEGLLTCSKKFELLNYYVKKASGPLAIFVYVLTSVFLLLFISNSAS